MDSDKPVRACMCYPHSFEELKSLAKAHHWQNVEEIATAVGCGSGCGLCRPYLSRMLTTGETAFAVLPPQKIEEKFNREIREIREKNARKEIGKIKIDQPDD